MTLLPAPPAGSAAQQHAPTRAAATSPLWPAYAALNGVLGHLRVEESAEPGAGGPAAGWLRGADLVEDAAALDAFVDASERESTAAYGVGVRRDVAAGFALHRYAWPATALFSLPYFLVRRVPRLAPADVALHSDEGRVAVRVREFACLPDDPAVGAPGARPVASEEALRAELRGALSAHMAPVLEVFAPRMRRRARAMWGTATDELVEGLWYVGKLLGEERRARTEAELILPGSTAPFSGGAAFRDIATGCGGRLPTRDRVTCCFFYTLRPDATCVTCPRTSDAERVAREGRPRPVEQDADAPV
ncbi:(2Fe-2S)-binding protein [Streptomyces bohaiensis]|uniref:(2Fe-2S)-binding protein n=1 Tax=Streptomyces bohaiensis TaxID=1431344 RepID=A0ABX1CA37_9ACTN|nr:(2Fe-2S)-binding protein [Streptomyces bohaiensis]NJQ14750.1 (2Fe-2S)-binding protein [Streptomyces bohaiensis]